MGHCCRIFTPVQPVYPAASVRDFLSGALNLLVDAIKRCQQAGEVRAGSPRELALGAWAIVHGLALLAVDRRLADRGFSSDDPLVLARKVTQQLYLGLRPSAPRPT